MEPRLDDLTIPDLVRCYEARTGRTAPRIEAATEEEYRKALVALIGVLPTHTPGPWSREPGTRFKHDRSAGVKAANGLFIACALDRNRYDLDDEVEANARLIAAAPELLAAAERARAFLEMFDARTIFAETHPDLWYAADGVIVSLRAALATARGEQP